ncbi:dom [Symbiodinium sp. CCMP2592]|nr:dom [Symbiodinium sp. CCMP2592]
MQHRAADAGVAEDALPQAAQVRRAAQAVLRVEAKRRAVAKKAAKQVQALLRQLQRNEAQRLEEEQRFARAGAARIAKEIAKFWSGCCRAAEHFAVQQRHAARTQQHFENMQALLSRSEAFSSEVTTGLLADQAPREGLEKEPKRDSSTESKQAQNSLEELERSPRLHYDDFDRRNMSKQITTEVPVLLLRHPIREYQHIGLHWLATLHDKQFNGILADEMGLGKTIMTIALLAHLAVQKEVWGPHLVVVPTSLLMNWVKELQKWAPGLKVCAYYGNAKERRDKRRGWGGEDAFHVCVASYTVVLQDLRPLKMKRWYYLILDEAQNIKNYRSQKWQQLMRFKSERRLLLTGTPLQNNLTELWSLLHFLMPDMFQSYTDFKEFFADPLHLALHEHRVKQEQELVARLHKVIRPFLLRRLKSEVERQLPKKHEHVVSCPLSRRQQVLYEEFMRRRQTQQILKKGDYLRMMSILMQLRKVCNHPELLEPRGADTSFVMHPLAVKLPPLVSLDLWLNVAGRSCREENFCALLLPLISLWKFELMLKTQNHKALPISEVVEMSLHQAPKRRRVSEAAAELRCQVSPGSREFLDEWHLQMCRVDEERKRERCSAVSAVDLLVQLVSEGRPWIGADGMELLSLHCRSGTAFSLTKRLPPRPFMWPELQRSSMRLSLASRGVVLPEERRRNRCYWSSEARMQTSECFHRKPFKDKRRAAGMVIFDSPLRIVEQIMALLPCLSQLDGALAAMSCSILRDLESNVAARVGMWAFRVPRVQVSSSGSAFGEQDAADTKARFCAKCCMLRSPMQLAGAMGDSARDVLDGRLRCHLPEKHHLESDCGKLRKLAIMLKEFKARNDKCIIFTQFSKMLDVLETFVCHHSFTYVRMDSAVKVDRRQDLVDRFNDDERIFLFICSTRAGGVGINLMSANTVIFYDSDWNPAMDRQATDRAHRIGQTREVHIYRLVSDHTIEENIWRRQLQKRELDDMVVDQGRFTTEELEHLHKGASAAAKPEEVGLPVAAKSIAWSAAEVRAMLQDGQDPEPDREGPLASDPEPRSNGHVAESACHGMVPGSSSEQPTSISEFEKVLQKVEDTEDAQMAASASLELQQTECLLKGDFQARQAPPEKPEKLDWLSLPRLVRWGVHRIRVLEVEEVLARQRPRTRKRRAAVTAV